MISIRDSSATVIVGSFSTYHHAKIVQEAEAHELALLMMMMMLAETEEEARSEKLI